MVVFAPIGLVIVAKEAMPLAARVGVATIRRRLEIGLVPNPGSTMPGAVDDPSGRPPTADAVEVVGPPVGRAGDPDGLPLDDYDHLAARQVVDRLSALSDSELVEVATYETSHRHRRTILGKIEQLQA